MSAEPQLAAATRKGMAAKVARGGFPHRAPIGYRNEPLSRTIVPDPDRAPYVRRMFELYAQGGHSIQELSDQAVADGVIDVAPGANLPRSSRLHNVLRNPFYAGFISWGGQLHRGRHEAIVGLELFNVVQERLRDKRGRRTWTRDRSFILAGLLTCGGCGYRMCPRRIKQRYVYYHCATRGCLEPYYRETDLVPEFEALVRSIRLTSQVCSWLQETIRLERQAHPLESPATEPDVASVVERTARQPGPSAEILGGLIASVVETCVVQDAALRPTLRLPFWHLLRSRPMKQLALAGSAVERAMVFWSPVLGRKLTPEEARQIIDNLAQHVHYLELWDRETLDAAPPEAD